MLLQMEFLLQICEPLAFLPKLATSGHVLRDASHAGRRAIGRPWAASARLRNAVGHFGRAKWSFAQKIAAQSWNP